MGVSSPDPARRSGIVWGVTICTSRGRAYGAWNNIKLRFFYREASPTGFHRLDFPLALFHAVAQLRIVRSSDAYGEIQGHQV